MLKLHFERSYYEILIKFLGAKPTSEKKTKRETLYKRARPHFLREKRNSWAHTNKDPHLRALKSYVKS